MSLRLARLPSRLPRTSKAPRSPRIQRLGTPGAALLILALCLGPAAAALAAVTPAAPPAASQESTTEAARRVVHLLDYVASDYPGAVAEGRVKSATEYQEQREFVARIGKELTDLGVAERDPLRDRLAALQEAVVGLAPPETVAARAHEMEETLRGRFDLRALPPRLPDVAHGRQLYGELCASCHGAAGHGDGPAAVGLDPPPAKLTDPARMLAQSPFALFNTISFGVDGTAMPAFVEKLDDADRYDLAFFVGSLAFPPAEVKHGQALVEQMPERVAARVPDLAALVEHSADALGADAESRAVVAYLRTHPEALRSGELPAELAQRRLAASWDAYRGGDPEHSLELAISAYLDGFEPLEPALDAVDHALRLSIEAEFAHYRSLVNARRPEAEVAPAFARLRDGLSEVELRLTDHGLGPTALFASSMAIIAREGFEAVLVVIALFTVLVRSGRRDALPYLHAGWLAALPAGAATWVAARTLVEVSGAQREVIEGVTAILATGILFYVSYWLLARSESARWQAFIDRTVRGALSKGSLWTLALVSFVAVYRELFETILFYEALFAQAAPGAQHAILLGIGAGGALLAILAVGLFRFGLRLSLRHFFAASSVLLYALAVVLAGDGVAALQEVGWIPVTWVHGVTIEWLGIHPTAQGLAVQGVLLLAALATVPVLWLSSRRARPSAAQDPAPSSPRSSR